MKEKKPTTEFPPNREDWAQQTYRTGGTQPPKSHGGLIAFLLVVIIFLCGISTALGMMNVRLFRQLTTLSYEKTSPIAFSRSNGESAELTDTPLGFIGQEIPPFWQNYHDLPQGIYVTKVIAGSQACKLGVLPGDILISLNDTPISSANTFQQLLDAYAVGDTVTACFVRQGQSVVLSLILE